MCCDENNPGASLSFSQFVRLLQQPPFEPCESELKFLTPVEYDKFFTEVMRCYFRPITYHIASITNDYNNAADIAQEVFINLYKARITFEKAYIYRSAKNAAYSELRRRTRQRYVLYAFQMGIKENKRGKCKQMDTPDTRPLQDTALIERAREEALRTAIERLPEYFRVPLELLAEGKSYKQIIEITQVNEGTVKSRICRGKRVLRRRLRAYL